MQSHRARTQTRGTPVVFPVPGRRHASMGPYADRFERRQAMEQLTIIGTEDDTIVLATESGERFALAVDDVLRAELRKARQERNAEARTPRPSPREVQAHIRAGLSAAEVAELL